MKLNTRFHQLLKIMRGVTTYSLLFEGMTEYSSDSHMCAQSGVFKKLCISLYVRYFLVFLVHEEMFKRAEEC